MTEKRIVDEYNKIKPDADLKNRIMCEVLALESEKTRKPFFRFMKPLVSGALACLVFVLCLTVIPFNNTVDPNGELGYGAFSVAYNDGVEIVPTSNTYALAKLSDDYYEYDTGAGGKTGAEFTFNFEGKTCVDTDYGLVYEKTEDGKYDLLPSNAVLDGEVTLFWEMPDGETDEACVMTLVNQSGKWMLALELFPDGYKANLLAE